MIRIYGSKNKEDGNNKKFTHEINLCIKRPNVDQKCCTVKLKISFHQFILTNITLVSLPQYEKVLMPYCPYCSNDVSPTAKMCPNCGDNLRKRKVFRAFERYWQIPAGYLLSIVFLWLATESILVPYTISLALIIFLLTTLSLTR